ncbi:MAG: FAD-dependent oxidoreductase [Bacteroidales bacterium]|nr:FAD-dependent oxidoreductase [Bacteroidales bacterium]
MKRTFIGAMMLLAAAIAFSCCEKHAPVNPTPGPQTDTTQKDTTQKDTVKVNPLIGVEPQYAEDGTGTVIIIGGGASGVSAGIQAARMGVKTTIIEESPWVGGMLTSCGVTATDGCANLRGGIFKEFCDALANHYGNYSILASGWVSNVLFEPKVGEQIFEKLCEAEPNLSIVRNTRFESCRKLDKGWEVSCTDASGRTATYSCDVLIDGTELGDVAKAAGVRYHVGMDSPSYGNEAMAIGPNDVVQDITMVMTIKNYGKDVTIPKPDGYNAELYYNCCANKHNRNVSGGKDLITGQSIQSAEMMITYGKTPGGTYMINWPTHGNDYYVNMIEMDRAGRDAEIAKAKNVSLGFLYFMQTELGFNTYGMCDDQYPTEDKFPFYPYHRESRRIEGEYLFTVNDEMNAFAVPAPGYRTGIAVGDYPVDHHHHAYDRWAEVVIDFPKIKPFTIPLGCMVPLGVDDLIVAEKSISVTNLANGSTRLQPVCVELGQAAGALAALSVKYGKPVREVDIRKVQKHLMESGAMTQPYRDCLCTNTDFFGAVHRVGCTGILRGKYVAEGWSNICTFRMADKLTYADLYLEDYYGIPYNSSSAQIKDTELKDIIESVLGEEIEGWSAKGNPISRAVAAQKIDTYLNPFWREVDWKGNLVKAEK